MMFITLTLLIYIALLLLLFYYQKTFIFFPPENNLLRFNSWKDNEITIPGEYSLQAWHINNNIMNNIAIVYYGGNAEEVSSGLELAKKYNATNVFCVNLNGYGKSEGTPSKNNFYKSGLSAFQYICRNFNITESNITLMGRSLGSATASYIASKTNPKSLILITPFQSIMKMVPKMIKVLFPMQFILRHKFDNEKNLRTVNCPVLVIAASNDEIIPIEQTKEVFSSIKSDALYKIIENTDHQNILYNQACLNVINDFIR